jgi:hypothetical protein
MFRGRHITIATKHGKEKALAPLVSTFLQAIPITCNTIDTDQFGTFSGEIERQGTPIDTLRAKIKLAYELTGETKIIVSEGSFGSHPASPFISANEEWLLYADLELDHEILVRSLTTETNFSQLEIEHESSLIDFAQKAGFPENGLILTALENNKIHKVAKDFESQAELLVTYFDLKHQFENVHVQTDMRAHKNLLRMQHIEAIGRKLMERMMSNCPACTYPGFGIISHEKGLPCKYCQAPTNDIQAEILACAHCKHTTKNMCPAGRHFADPGICSFCNP